MISDGRPKRGIRLLLGLITASWLMMAWIAPAVGQARPNAKQKKIYETLVSEGRSLYNEEKYQEAIDRFERAFEIIPDMKLLFNMAQSHRLAGNVEKALMLYRRFLDALPEIRELSQAKKTTIISDVKKWIDQLETEKRTLEEKAEKERLEKAEKERLEKERLEKERLERERLEALAISAAPPKADWKNLTSKWWFWTGVGTTVLLALGSTWAGTQVLSYNDDWKRDWHTSDRDKARLYQDIADISLVGALSVGLAVSVYSYFHLRSGSLTVAKKASPVALVPACDGSGCMLSLTLEF